MINVFSTPFDNYVLKGDIYSAADEKSEILVLHGAGISSRKRYDTLREFLLAYKIGLCAFDCIGHGETGGNLSGSSLKERTEQALTIIEAQKLSAPLILVGASMGAYTAIKLSGLREVDKLILFVPAVYSAEAYEVLFTDQFSEIIRKPKSWMQSDAWEILSKFRGELLVIQAGQDDVIPKELVTKSFESASIARKKELCVVSDAPHQILGYLNDHPEEREKVFNKIADFITV
jgi:alpha-beta hydrolase superfamily lysophospholipase